LRQQGLFGSIVVYDDCAGQNIKKSYQILKYFMHYNNLNNIFMRSLIIDAGAEQVIFAN